MEDDLLETARRQAETASGSVRAAALLRIARAESTGDLSRAKNTLREGLDAARMFPLPVREHLLDEARRVAAAVSPELLDEIPGPNRHRNSFESVHIVQTMIDHGHRDAAFHYLLQLDEPDTFPFLSVATMIHRLDPEPPERRLILLRHAVEMWRQSPPVGHSHHRNEFVRLFGHLWKEFPVAEASAVAHAVVKRAIAEPDTETSASYGNEIHFSSTRQNTLFQVLHVLRHVDPALARSLVDSQDQLAAAVRRYPNGLETMHEEAEAEAKRRRTDGATCGGGGGGGFIFGGDPRDFDHQCRLMEAIQRGDFARSIEEALEKYREDTSDAPNAAPKEYWPSTGEFRTIFHRAGERLGVDAATLLEQVPDDDIRLFASIELAAALAGVPGPTITYMRKPNAARDRRFGRDVPKMRSPDGRLIRCPKCLFQPPIGLRWVCKCGHSWNTFWTSGLCPACRFQWEETQCPNCREKSEHRAWYIAEP